MDDLLKSVGLKIICFDNYDYYVCKIPRQILRLLLTIFICEKI